MASHVYILLLRHTCKALVPETLVWILYLPDTCSRLNNVLSWAETRIVIHWWSVRLNIYTTVNIIDWIVIAIGYILIKHPFCIHTSNCSLNFWCSLINDNKRKRDYSGSIVRFINHFKIILDFPIADFVNVHVFWTDCKLVLFNTVNQLPLLNCTILSLFVHYVFFMIPSVYTLVIGMYNVGKK